MGGGLDGVFGGDLHCDIGDFTPFGVPLFFVAELGLGERTLEEDGAGEGEEKSFLVKDLPKLMVLAWAWENLKRLGRVKPENFEEEGLYAVL